MRCHASPASRPRILSVTARMGRLSRHYSSSSTATLPHAGALRHEPVMRRIAPEHRATHGVAAPVTNFRLREISDRGRPRSRPPAPATAAGGAAVPPSERRRPGIAAPSPRRCPHRHQPARQRLLAYPAQDTARFRRVARAQQTSARLLRFQTRQQSTSSAVPRSPPSAPSPARCITRQPATAATRPETLSPKPKPSAVTTR